MFCLPTSNAEIEWVFSQVSVIKTQKRARMNTDRLESILYCRFRLTKFDVSVANFVPPKTISTIIQISIYKYAVVFFVN